MGAASSFSTRPVQDHPSWTPLVLPEPVSSVAAHGRYVVAALDDGRVLRSHDGGATWRPAVDGRVPEATALLASRDALLAGTPAGVVRAVRADGWKPAPGVPPSVAVTALAARGATTIAGTLRAGVFRSADGGAHWEATGRGLPLGGARLRVYAAAGSAHGLVVAHAFGVSRSADGGHSWSSAGVGLPLQVPRAALAADGAALYAGVGGRLYRAASPQAEPVLVWTEVHDGPGLGRPLELLRAAHGVLYAAASAPPFLLASRDEGTSWQGLGEALPAPPVGLTAAGPWLLAVLPDGSLWRTLRLRGEEGALPDVLDLHVEDTAISFALGVPAPVVLTLHDGFGAEVAVVARGPFAAGRHRVALPPGLPPGLYRCRLRAGPTTRAVPLALLGPARN